MFKDSFSFAGRIRRSEYGISFTAYLFCYYFIWGMDEGRGGDLLALLLVIPAMWFALAQGAKRCHDIGKSGWWQLVPLYMLWLLFKKGDKGINAYGEDPKAVKFADNDDYEHPYNYRRPEDPRY